MTCEVYALSGKSIVSRELDGARTSLLLDMGFMLWSDSDNPSRGWSGGGKEAPKAELAMQQPRHIPASVSSAGSHEAMQCSALSW